MTTSCLKELNSTNLNWIVKKARDPTDPILDTGFFNVPDAQGTSRG